MRVLNRHRDQIPKDAVYIGRPSKWGNPFTIGKHGTRAEVVMKYANYINSHPTLAAEARAELAGKDLVCFCAPQECHGDILMEVANS